MEVLDWLVIRHKTAAVVGATVSSCIHIIVSVNHEAKMGATGSAGTTRGSSSIDVQCSSSFPLPNYYPILRGLGMQSFTGTYIFTCITGSTISLHCKDPSCRTRYGCTNGLCHYFCTFIRALSSYFSGLLRCILFISLL